MEAYQQRVVEEKKALDTKLEALEKFIATPASFGALPGDEQFRLKQQRNAMQAYANILGQRIGAFPAAAPAPGS
jgi:division protein CdvB (Snf7/Vps24/ESCRT-III family)